MDSSVKEPRKNHDQSLKMEIAEAAKSIGDLLGDDEQAQLLKSFLLRYPQFKEEEIQRSIEGVKEEDEFAFMCRLMGTASYLVRLDQKHTIPGKYSVPDFLAHFQPGCDISECSVYRPEREQAKGFSCLIDVKARYGLKCQIKGTELKRLRVFSSRLNLPLIFAVRFTKAKGYAYWVMVEDDQTKDEIVIVPEDFDNGVRAVFWNEAHFEIPCPLELSVNYCNAGNRGALRHEDLGYVQSARVRHQGREISFDAADAAIVTIFFESLRAMEDVETYKVGNTTTIVSRIINNAGYFATADSVLSINSRTLNRSGAVGFDSSQVLLPNQGSCGEPELGRKNFETILLKLQRLGLVGLVSQGTLESHTALCRRYNGLL